MDDLIVKTITRIIIPFIQVYGIYIVLHGHISPGGGFSGGAILGASLILYTLAFGYKDAAKKMPHHVGAILESGAILWFLALGLIGIFAGGNFLTNRDAGFYMGNLSMLFNAGLIPLVTLGIGAKVASTMITLFHTIIEED
ncbi:multicomponent Na+:H+ antiporter subunit B [Natronincola peptidivorans]|uniref:Multicomponent Na+:H+ antiporter subunit B n=1 Tax=Natronincola peptidivorans TaxID=426128 RepID=A0A1I0BJC5_9FIRM|nr:MnhB domain-containing protein [Natronincola peptidivorans]SET06738.1 multicomponent Na+:H+ antiporter subunit B [Natronincola peptidivorans]